MSDLTFESYLNNLIIYSFYIQQRLQFANDISTKCDNFDV